MPALALERALRHYEVCASSATLGELQQVLLRPKFDRYVSAAQRQVFLDGIVPHLRMVEVIQHTMECADPKDDAFLAFALTVDAELIIASDPQLTQMHPWRSIPILPPAAFLVGARNWRC